MGPEPVPGTARHSVHTDGRQPTLRQVRAIGDDIADEMRKAFEQLELVNNEPAAPETGGR